MQRYNGFVYLWFDSEKRMFYLGSHYGNIEDGYIGSGIRFLRAYNIRPLKFKRKIVEYIVGDYNYLQLREQAWLNLIEDEELHIKYYNQKKWATGGSVKGRKQPKTEEHIQKLRKPRKDTSNFHAPKSEEHRRKISEGLKGVDRALSKNGMFGKKHSEETLVKIKEKAQNREKVTCPYCQKESLPCHYTRYHGINCRLYELS